MSELFSIQLQNRQQQRRDGVWLDLPTTTEQVQAALRQIGISSDNPQGLFISGYFAEEEKRFAIPYNMVMASSVDELNFLAARLETLSAGERAELNAALQAPQSELSSIGRITDFPENVDYYVHLPDVRGPAQLGDYYLNRSGMVDMPEEWKGGIDTAQFGRYVAQQEQIDLTPDGAELLSRLADGALRDGLSLLDQCAAAGGTVDSRAVLEVLGLAGNLQTAQLMRDLGSIQAPQNAFYLNLGLESLHVRMKRHCENAQKVAEFLQQHEKVAWVQYCGLPGDKYYELGKKYLPNGSCGVVSFGVKGGRAAAEAFMGRLKIAAIETHVADARTCCLHPANATHRQMNDEQLAAAGVPAELVRMSCGLESAEDLIADIAQALDKV